MQAEDTIASDKALALTLAEAPDAPLCVGYSGGRDSSVLLHLLAQDTHLRQRGLRAIHVHHGLHADADGWARHCQRFCDGLDIALTIATVTVDPASGYGPEAAARAARHAAFASALGSGETLALAHHREDQAETFLLRALRASSVDGLAAMRRVRDFGDGVLWRPLLDVSQASIERYAQRHALQWVDDPSNTGTDFDRNFLRHRVLPLLRERWPHADTAFARSAGLSAQAADLLANEDAAALLQASRVDGKALDVAELGRLPAARRGRVLRRWIQNRGLPPLPAQGLARIESDLLPASIDTHAQFAWADAVIHRWRDQLYAGTRQQPLPPGWQTSWGGCDALQLPHGGTLTLQGVDGFDSALRVHTRQGGERITLPGRSHSHALKHVLQAQDVPPWLRTAMPLLSDGQTLLAAGDVVYSAPFAAWLAERGACLSWTHPL